MELYLLAPSQRDGAGFDPTSLLGDTLYECAYTISSVHQILHFEHVWINTSVFTARTVFAHQMFYEKCMCAVEYKNISIV